MNTVFQTSPSPHIRTNDTITSIMWCVVISLIPALFFSIYNFGFIVLKPVSIAIVTAVIVELVILAIRKKELSTVLDGSAVLTGLLLAFNIPPDVPWWLPMIGSFVAIAVAKQAFGGIGYNIFNPALIGRAFLLAAWPVEMTTWQLNGVTGATPLGIFKEKGMDTLISKFANHSDMIWKLFYGEVGGCIGETSALLLLLGAGFLLYKKIITWHIPFSYIGTLFVFGWFFSGKGILNGDPWFYILSGGVFLGAFFMVTDMVTSPLTKKGKLIFGFGCGLLTFLIRKFGAYPEGVSYSILIMNAFTPIIDRYIVQKKFGSK